MPGGRDRDSGEHTPDRRVVIGRISGLYGVRGWVKVFSHTDPRDNILRYSTWYLESSGSWQRYRLLEGRLHGKGIVARIEGCNDRNLASRLVGRRIAIGRDQLPVTEPDEHYWTDLEGLRVRTTDGVDLGTIDHLFGTGSNDVMVVRGERERWIPYVPGSVVREVDLGAGLMLVDWDPSF